MGKLRTIVLFLAIFSAFKLALGSMSLPLTLCLLPQSHVLGTLDTNYCQNSSHGIQYSRGQTQLQMNLS